MRRHVWLCGNSGRSRTVSDTATVRFDNELVGRVVDMDILAENHDFIVIAKEGSNLFQRYAFGLWQEEPRPYGAETRDNDEYLYLISSAHSRL